MTIASSTRLGSASLLFLLAACGQAPSNDTNVVTSSNETVGVAHSIAGEDTAPAAPAPVEANTSTPETGVAATDMEATPPAPSGAGANLSDAQIEAQYTPALDKCLNSGDAANGVSVAMGTCFRTELAVQDARLNAAYKSAMAKRDAAGQAALRNEERAWIKRRDADCEAERSGGTIDMVQIPQCILNETIRRRVTLQPMAG